MPEDPKKTESQAITLDYASPSTDPKQPFPWSRVFEWLIALGLFFFVATVMWPPLGRARPNAPRTQCAAQLHQIVTVLMAYANHHGGQFPDSLEIAVTDPASPMTPQTWAKVLICPESKGTPASGTTASEVAKNISSHGMLEQLFNSESHPSLHLSYVYAGKGITMKSDPKTVLVFEPPDHHFIGNVPSMNVAYRDGSVRTFSGPAAVKLFADLQAGRNPPSTQASE